MKLLIVVDKLLTGFDAPSATYLYIDKSMQDHGLFQAICRVNRVDNDSKEYGYIIDYKDLFKDLQQSITDYTSQAFDNYDDEDVKGLLKDRQTESKDRLETALEALVALCEPVHPKDEPGYIKYFCGDTETMTLKNLKKKELACTRRWLNSLGLMLTSLMKCTNWGIQSKRLIKSKGKFNTTQI